MFKFAIRMCTTVTPTTCRAHFLVQRSLNTCFHIDTRAPSVADPSLIAIFQVCSLAQMLLDPYYRTMHGFQVCPAACVPRCKCYKQHIHHLTTTAALPLYIFLSLSSLLALMCFVRTFCPMPACCELRARLWCVVLRYSAEFLLNLYTPS